MRADDRTVGSVAKSALSSDEKNDVDDDEDGAGAEPNVSVYDLQTLDLVCVFTEPVGEDPSDESEGAAEDRKWRRRRRRFISVQFLYDNISVAALVVDPDGYGGAMYYYRWRNSTMDTCVRVDGHVADVSAERAEGGQGGRRAGGRARLSARLGVGFTVFWFVRTFFKSR